MPPTLQLRGEVRWELLDPRDGTTRDERTANQIVDGGVAAVIGLLHGSQATVDDLKIAKMVLGTGTAPTTRNMTAPQAAISGSDKELGDASTIASVPGEITWQAEWPASGGAGQSVTEICLLRGDGVLAARQIRPPITWGPSGYGIRATWRWLITANGV